MLGLIICEFEVYGESVHPKNGKKLFLFIHILAVFSNLLFILLLHFLKLVVADGPASMAVDTNPGVETYSITNGKKLIPPFWASGDICPGFQNQGRTHRLHASFPACNGFLKFTSGATLTDLLFASLAAELFQSTYICTTIAGV